MNIAVILAGGVGSRVGCATPKQFLKVAGKTVIEHTIDVFDGNSLIDEIAVVINPSYVDEMESVVARNQWKKVRRVLKGGSERYLSTLSAIEAYKGYGNCNMIFHDAVRPLVSERVINDVVCALERNDAVGVAVPVTDTIFEVDGKGRRVLSIPERGLLRRAQTPQGFKYGVVAEAYERALRDPSFRSTDDCGTVLRYMPEVDVFVVDGDEMNMKVTYKEDLFVVERFLERGVHK